MEMRSKFLAGVWCVARARRAGRLVAEGAARVVGGHCSALHLGQSDGLPGESGMDEV